MLGTFFVLRIFSFSFILVPIKKKNLALLSHLLVQHPLSSIEVVATITLNSVHPKII